MSVLCWSLSGACEVFYASQDQYDPRVLDGLRSIFSLFNSLFILLALPWFKYLPDRVKPLVSSIYWYIIIGLPFLFSLLPTLRKIWSGAEAQLISELDVYYSFLTLAFLGSVLWTSFKKRRLILLAFLSLLSVGITLIAQLYKLTDASINLTLFSAIFKTTLIMIFFALALSWVKELAENIIPEASELSLKLYHEIVHSNKINHYARITGIPGLITAPVLLTPANFELLTKFAKKRLSEKDEWLEIKPKDEHKTADSYDIRDHNEIKRLLQNLLNGLFGKNQWTREQHYLPLKHALFELSQKRERKIRLRIPKQQIIL